MVHRDLKHLLQRAKQRMYTDTLSILVFYWLQTLRERYSPEHWAILQAEARAMAGGVQLEDASEGAVMRLVSEWVPITSLRPGPRVKEHLAPPFTSAHLAPPARVSQAYLETLLGEWLPEAVLDQFGDRMLEEGWTSENAYQEIALCLETILKRHAQFPGLDVVRALDRIQQKQLTMPDELDSWRRKRQASLESLVSVPLHDASVVDPKVREILTDVILYLLGSTQPAPLPDAGSAWLLPWPTGADLPPDLARQVREVALPEGYGLASMVLIPLKCWQPAQGGGDGMRRISIHSSILTPDGRVWEAHHVEHEAGRTPGVVYRSVGKIDVVPDSTGLSFRIPVTSVPAEVGAQANQAAEFTLFHHRWRLHRFEASTAGCFATFRSVSAAAQIHRLVAASQASKSQTDPEQRLLQRAS